MKAFGLVPGPVVLTAMVGVAVLLRPYALMAQEARSGAGPGTVTVEIRGVVQDHETGEPLADAAVSLATGPNGTPGRGTRITNAQGRFLFRDVPSGTYRMTVTLLSYHTLADTLVVGGDRPLDLLLPLSTDPIPLDPIVVEADREQWTRMGYQGRDRAGAGPFFLNREEIQRRQPNRLTDLIAIVPGVRVVGQRGVGRTVLLRGGCRPTVVIDGVRMAGFQGIDMMARPGDTESVRVYHGAELPVQYGLNACGGIVIETRRGGPPEEGKEPKGGIWRYVVGFGLALFTVFLMR